MNTFFTDIEAKAKLWQELNPALLGKNKYRIRLRYLNTQLRESFGLRGIPLRLTVRKSDNPCVDKSHG